MCSTSYCLLFDFYLNPMLQALDVYSPARPRASTGIEQKILFSLIFIQTYFATVYLFPMEIRCKFNHIPIASCKFAFRLSQFFFPVKLRLTYKVLNTPEFDNVANI